MPQAASTDENRPAEQDCSSNCQETGQQKQGDAVVKDEQDHKEKEEKPTEKQPAARSTSLPPGSTSPTMDAEVAGESLDQHHANGNAPFSSQVLSSWKAWFALRDTVAQWLMAALGVVATGISVWAVVLLRRTLDATKEAVVEARAANKAAEDVVAVAQTTATLELRAYLSVEPDGINQLIGRTKGVGQVIVRNVGKLPARHVFVDVRMKLAPDREQDFEPPADEKSIERVIQPGTAMRQGSKNYISVDSLSGKSEYVYVWGVAYYDDGYEQRRFTRFCHRYSTASRNAISNPNAKPKSTKCLISPEKARYHTAGNDAN